MQHSPQEIKSRLDRAVDPEGNVLDMAAVLELVTTLERLPITREALEATRIGKTINLLRKKTNNEVLAKRAKKLVKKWQKLVINQLGATRNVDSPINGSRISSPQINGTLSETDGKSSTPTLTERTVKSISINDYKTKGVKRKRSSSSTGNSPLTLVEASTPDKSRSLTPTNASSDSKSLAPTNGSSSKNELIQSKEISSSSVAQKKPKLMDDQTKLLDEKDDPSLTHTSESSSKQLTNSGNSDSNSIEKDVTSGAQEDINIIENSDKKDWVSGTLNETKYVNNSSQSSDKANFSNVYDNARKDSKSHDVNSEPVDGQNHSMLTQRENTNITHTEANEEMITRVKEKNGLDVECTKIDTKYQKDSEMCNVIEERKLDSEKKMLLESSEGPEPNQISNELSPKGRTENLLKEMVSKTSEETDEMLDDTSEPKELVLDLNEEANGINGRYNDNGTWYSWTDIMPYNDGTLNILPYVILD